MGDFLRRTRLESLLAISLAAAVFACKERRVAKAQAAEPPPPQQFSDSEPRLLQPATETARQAKAAPVERMTPVAKVASVAKSPSKLDSGKFNSAQACGACHQAIYSKWSHSMHSNSYQDPVFKEALYKAHYLSEGKAAPACLRCHSPTTVESKDFYGTTEITREGVTCDYCHSIGALSTDATGLTQYQIDWTQKHGPYEKSESPAHKVGFRPFFEKSEICAGCHDMATEDGTMIFATYSEWKASKYAEEGRQCHDCHMPRLSGLTVKDGLKLKGHDIINDHELLGGHEPSQVRQAVMVKVESLTRDGDRVHAVVTMTNSGAGHYVPTGIPSRKLVLTVSATQRRRVIFQREIVYQRVMQSADNRTLTEDWEIKLLSKRVLRDNRLAPLEVRRENFVFNASPDDDVDLAVRLNYLLGSGNVFRTHVDVEIAELDQVLRRGLR